MHSCPECSAACYCNGDIEDIDCGSEESQLKCEHYLACLGRDDLEYEEESRDD